MKWFSVFTVEQGMTSLSETTMGDHKKTIQLRCRKERWESGGCTCHAHPVGSLFQGESWPTSKDEAAREGIFTLRSSEAAVKGRNCTTMAAAGRPFYSQSILRLRSSKGCQAERRSLERRRRDRVGLEPRRRHTPTHASSPASSASARPTVSA